MAEEIPNEVTLQLEISKLKEEVRSLEYNNWWANRLLQSLSFITTLLAVAAFGFGIYQFYEQQQKDVEAQGKENERQQNEISALNKKFQENIFEIEKQNRNKFYEKQLEVFFNLSEAAAKTAVEKDGGKRELLYKNFLELYYGRFVIADYNEDIKNKADKFKKSYEDNSSDQSKLQESARDLSIACRDWISSFWGLLPNNNFKDKD